jgi:hypothetical protein
MAKKQSNEATLFIGIHSTCVCYCDKSKEEDGDFKTIARLFFDALELKIYEPQSTLLPKIREHAAEIQARKGQEFQVSGCGQTVILGGR